MQEVSNKLQKRNYKEKEVAAWCQMHGSRGLGMPLVKHGLFGADILSFAPRASTEVHTHPGDHILFVVAGGGFLVFDGEFHNLAQGDCYFVPGAVPHQVGAAEISLTLLSIANDHRPVDSAERLDIV